MRNLIHKHPSQGELQAYLDQELVETSQQRLEGHLEACPGCQRRLDALHEDIAQVDEQLTALTLPLPAAVKPVNAARASFESYIREKEKAPMSRSLSNRMRWTFGVLAFVALFSLAFAFPQVRAIANDFLGLFRIEQIALIPFDFNNSQAQQAGNNIGQWLDQNAIYQEVGQPQRGVSREEAAAATGIPVRLPVYENLGDPYLSVESGLHAEFTVDLPRIRSILQEAGYTDLSLPDNLDQAQIVIDVPQPVVAAYGNCGPGAYSDPDEPARSNNSSCFTLVQVFSPVVNTPPDLNLQQLGKVFLQLSGMHEADAEAFSQNVDWTTTLVMPVNRDSEYEEIQIDGVQGVLLRERYNYNRYTIFWIKDGVLYGLSGNNNSFNARRIAESLQ